MRNAPTFMIIFKFAGLFESFKIINKTDLALPGELVNFVVEDGDAFTEIRFIEKYFFILNACSYRNFGNPGVILTGAFIQLPAAHCEALRKSSVVMWIGTHECVGYQILFYYRV